MPAWASVRLPALFARQVWLPRPSLAPEGFQEPPRVFGVVNVPYCVLAIKLRNGQAPFTWLVNGQPIANMTYRRTARWVADGPGFVTISVVDATGRSDRVSIFVE